jgi:hypothetical protein
MGGDAAMVCRRIGPGMRLAAPAMQGIALGSPALHGQEIFGVFTEFSRREHDQT